MFRQLVYEIQPKNYNLDFQKIYKCTIQKIIPLMFVILFYDFGII